MKGERRGEGEEEGGKGKERDSESEIERKRIKGLHVLVARIIMYIDNQWLYLIWGCLLSDLRIDEFAQVR